ncbi:hypothetical protein KO500_06435 [Cellulophaga baltica]|uniref:hypothetical protein n=1 Tax=Cellulophaga TaxID=104264 RepID=UPI001C07C0CA|nr:MULTISPECIES: hypothetical protein [Cellulophaga]MBU2996062.1 hypothetical protein [Cellulophaga baltica]MDO6767457.1 hypothetical protein [Cellulophaga sp. 1_MG-2023]
MRKIATVLAVVVMNLGLFSCTSESATQDDSVYELQTLENASCNDCHTETPPRDPKG